ncbi:MAG: 2-amino-4-hydroxy-6-hydroxymethyldihydropteridine diphosphokinase [Sphingomonadaceae bacterium]|nr:2-amino-4-hydroxy-6-hydroxymethyldihydropteridine diphosphokinase [Sphingomonadaceae bacterium]
MHRYLIGLGSNRPHHRHGPPRRVLIAAMERLGALGEVAATSPVVTSAPLGPSLRRYANAVAVLDSALEPPALLAELKRLERRFGRRSGGQRWGSRVLDLDVVLWSGGFHVDPRLMVPHPRFRERAFVLGPALAVAPDWRDPLSGLSLRQLHARLTRPRPLPKAARVAGPVAQ